MRVSVIASRSRYDFEKDLNKTLEILENDNYYIHNSKKKFEKK